MAEIGGMAMSNAEVRAYQILKDVFGYSSFRNGQLEIIRASADKRDVLAVMPTGAGKSLCYQIPALMLDGITVVISPLISLMHDQISALRLYGVSAACINSTMSAAESDEVLYSVRQGYCRILYVAPERLAIPQFRGFACAAGIAAVCVDEAHCVSQWGHDFRPGYRDIPGFIESLPRRPAVSAFTATATAAVKADIASLLRLDKPVVVETGYDRPNLYFEVRKPKHKKGELLKVLQKFAVCNSGGNIESGDGGSSCIVYCSSRADTEDVCGFLNENGFRAGKYHAGMTAVERTQSQNDFIYDRVQVIVATVAFGMGIDKSDVRCVVHYSLPKSIENYYQEAGRAGRDGAPADCVLLYSGRDVEVCKFLISKKVDEGESASNISVEEYEARKGREYDMLRHMVFYCTASECLRGFLLKYFGELPPNCNNCGNCGNCGNCNGGGNFEEVDITVAAQKIVSVVYRLEHENRRNYGRVSLVQMLLGSGEKRIAELGLDRSRYFGFMREYSRERLNGIFDFLLASGFLAQIQRERFTMLSLGGRAGEVKASGFALTARLPVAAVSAVAAVGAESSGVAVAAVGAGSSGVAVAAVSDFDNDLLAQLRALRNSVARSAGVPAYVVFSDASLIDMCLKKPRNADEFLEVSGVGKHKLENYGAAFLELISRKLPAVVADDNAAVAAPVVAERKSFEEICRIIDEDAAFSDKPLAVSQVLDGLCGALIGAGVAVKISSVKITNAVLADGLLRTDVVDGRKCRVPSENGVAAGLSTVQRERDDGDAYTQVLYDRSGQVVVREYVKRLLRAEM